MKLLLYFLLFGVVTSVLAENYESLSAETLRKLEVGEILIIKRNGLPIISIIRRSAQDLINLEARTEGLVDPMTTYRSQRFNELLPIEIKANFISTANRSIRPELFVFVALGPNGPGCILNFYPHGTMPRDQKLFQIISEIDWNGGFIDSCDGSAYDLSGRVFEGHGEFNLEIPMHEYDEAGNLIIWNHDA